MISFYRASVTICDRTAIAKVIDCIVDPEIPEFFHMGRSARSQRAESIVKVVNGKKAQPHGHDERAGRIVLENATWLQLYSFVSSRFRQSSTVPSVTNPKLSLPTSSIPRLQTHA